MAAEPMNFADDEPCQCCGCALPVDDDQAYHPSTIKALHDRPLHDWKFHGSSILHTGIDPSGGGDPSNWAIATIGYEEGRRVVSAFLALEPNVSHFASEFTKCDSI